MIQAKNLIYDGSFNGFLSLVFKAFEEKITVADIQRNDQRQSILFTEPELVVTEVNKAKRVWNAIRKKNFHAIKNIYFTFLSDRKGVELLLYSYIKSMYSKENKLTIDPNLAAVSKINHMANIVGREKNQIEAHIKFQRSSDHIYFSTIEPEFNILPLVSKHFRSLYPDRPWVIYDVKRKYGLYYNLLRMDIITLDLAEIEKHCAKGNDLLLNEGKSALETYDKYFKNIGVKHLLINNMRTIHQPKKQIEEYEAEKTAI